MYSHGGDGRIIIIFLAGASWPIFCSSKRIICLIPHFAIRGRRSNGARHGRRRRQNRQEVKSKTNLTSLIHLIYLILDITFGHAGLTAVGYQFIDMLKTWFYAVWTVSNCCFHKGCNYDCNECFDFTLFELYLIVVVIWVVTVIAMNVLVFVRSL